MFLTLSILGTFMSKPTCAQVLGSWGAKIGVTSSAEVLQYVGGSTPSSASKRRVGYAIGVFSEWFSTRYFSLTTEVDYTQGGSLQPYYTVIEPPVYAWTYLNDRVDYLSVLISPKLTLPLSPVAPYIFAGPRVDFQLSYHREDFGGLPIDFPMYERFKKVLLGATLGAGIYLRRTLPLPLLVEIRYDPDFTTPYKDAFLSIHSNAFDVLIGLQL